MVRPAISETFGMEWAMRLIPNSAVGAGELTVILGLQEIAADLHPGHSLSLDQSQILGPSTLVATLPSPTSASE